MIDPELKKTIQNLKAAGRKNGLAIWKAIANELDKPKRLRTIVNLSRINRYTKAGDVVAIPGKVLAAGSLRHPVTVAAFAFSKVAKQKVNLAKGRALSLTELLDERIEPSRIKIMK
jgi:large subunit ribosomal protein L18e